MRTKKTTLLIIAFIVLSLQGFSQTFENAGQYLEYFGKLNQELSQKYLTYLSAVSHGKSARKVEKRREEVVKAISDTKFNVMGTPPFKGDKTLRDTTLAYYKMLNSVFNEDYGKIVNMEEIAEQSYDLMEAYMLAQEKATEKLQEAQDRQRETEKRFAAKHNVTLIDGESEIGNKMKTANQVTKHYDAVYLVFFKSHKQEAYIMDAMDKQNVLSMEQNINTQKKNSEAGMEKLKTLTAYSNDPMLITACQQALDFYKEEANQFSTLTDFLMLQDKFAKEKKLFDSKPASKRTQQDIDQYNKSINDINAASNNFNKTNNDLNKKRSAMLDNWNKSVKKYMDTYIPVQRR